MEPHSTQKKGRTCESCHQNPKALGLGYGKISLKDGKILFEALEKPQTKNKKVRLSQIVNLQGETLIKFNRKGMRGFNQEEIIRILRVGFCLNCHKENSPIFKHWKRNIVCPKFPEIFKAN
ncbi:MAG: hypothetical protein ABWJ99_07115 [Caldimicrobium sp.]